MKAASLALLLFLHCKNATIGHAPPAVNSAAVFLLAIQSTMQLRRNRKAYYVLVG
jgi:hypothetical protein